MIGVMIQKQTTRATTVLASDHQGVTKGLPMYEIMDQSKVRMPIPRPVDVPKSVFTTTLLGAIQQTQLNMLNPVHKYPGTQYHTKLHPSAIQKNFSRETWRFSVLPYDLCRVLNRAELTSAPGQIMLLGQTRNLRRRPPRE
jgi:hypothetical protein